MHLSAIFISISKDLVCSVIVGPVIGYPSECIAVHHSYSTLSICTNSYSFYICCLKMSFTYLLDAVNSHKCFFCFVITWKAGNQMLYEAITTLRLLPLPSLIISSFWGIMLCVSSCQHSLIGSVRSRWPKIKSHNDYTHQTFKCQTVRSAGLWGAWLKEFYCSMYIILMTGNFNQITWHAVCGHQCVIYRPHKVFRSLSFKSRVCCFLQLLTE